MSVELAQPTDPKLRVTGDMIINYRDSGIILVQRKYPPFQNHWAIPGGHIDIGQESTLSCAIREAKEETGLTIPPEIVRLLGVYSDPLRDPRGHYITTAYFCTVYDGEPKAMDDAKLLAIFPFNQIPSMKLAFDHRSILLDYLRTVLHKL